MEKQKAEEKKKPNILNIVIWSFAGIFLISALILAKSKIPSNGCEIQKGEESLIDSFTVSYKNNDVADFKINQTGLKELEGLPECLGKNLSIDINTPDGISEEDVEIKNLIYKKVKCGKLFCDGTKINLTEQPDFIKIDFMPYEIQNKSEGIIK